MKYVPQEGTATGRRLGRLLLGYLAVVVAAIVLSPFEFALPRGLAWPALDSATSADLLLNVVLFVPLGFLADRLGGGRRPAWHAALAGLLGSLAIETAQLFIPARFSSLADVAANGAGAWLGAVGSATMRRLAVSESRVVGRLLLDLPLVGFLWLMVPLLWLDALAAGDKVAVLAAASAAGVALAAAWASSAPQRAIAPGGVAMMAVAWGSTALSPLALVHWPTAALAMGLLVGGLLVGARQFVRLRERERRIESRAVTVVLVLMTPFLVATTIPGLVPGLGPDPVAVRQGIVRWLAGVAAFTVLGYLMAERRGRSPGRWPDTAFAPMIVAALVTPLANAGPGIAGRLLPAIIAAGFGALLFELQREHVIALRRRGDRARAAVDVTNLVSEG